MLKIKRINAPNNKLTRGNETVGRNVTGVITVVVESKMADLSVGQNLYKLWSETNGSSPKILSLDCGFSSVEITKRTIGQRNE